MRLHAGYTDRSNALTFGGDRHAALHRQYRHFEDCVAAGCDAILPCLGRAPRYRGAAPLFDGRLRIERRSAVHRLEPAQMAAVVEYRDDDGPVVFARFL